MAEPYLAEIRMTGFNFPPVGWAFCEGQLLSIAQNQALFQVFGTTYGGDGVQTFALPDLRARVAIGTGVAPGGSANRILGVPGGAATHTLPIAELPQHNHAALGSAADATLKSGVAGVPASTTSPSYTAPGNLVPMYSGALQPFGGGQPHANQQPFLAVRFIIALQGIFPSQG
jgi:microcystin-dependent protein